jgi:4-hydroxy-tetrahydrodipicolinate reductase
LQRGHQIPLTIDINNKADLNVANLKSKHIDVAIEFTGPETAIENYTICFEANVPVVSGTTGWISKYEEIKNYCNSNGKGFFWASNFSLGVNLFMELNKYLAKLMNPHEDYDCAMEEIHHTQKLDAPSGTAITLAEGVLANNLRKKAWKLNNISNKEDFQIVAKRLGTVPGTHTITYDSAVDSIEIKHEAKGRKGFALGSVIAAEYMKGKTSVFGMSDLLNL